MELVQKAIKVAFKAHDGQKRRISEAPYMVHLLEVVRLLMYEKVSEEVLVAGILHDTLEDTHYSAEEIEKEFGKNVLSLVEFVTEPENKPGKSREELNGSWKQRKQSTIDKCKEGTHEQLLVALADKLANVLSLREDVTAYGQSAWSSFHVSKKEIAWYYFSLEEVFSRSLAHTRMYKVYTQTITEVFGTPESLV